jgi:hypothetical protein
MPTDFSKVFEGKTAIVVGPAGCLLNDCQKLDVDSFDIVCRLNGHHRMCKKHGDIIGTRTDILYHAFEGFQYSADDVKEWVDSGLILVARNPQVNKLARVRKLGFDRYIDNIPSTMITKYKRELKCNPSTGVLAIFHALHFGASEVHAVGFDFYQTLYQTQKNEATRRKILNNKVGNHHPRKQLIEFKRVMKTCKNFFPHGKMKELMK